MAFDPANIPNALKEAYGAGRCGAYVGAGASAGAGLPLWGGLLELMVQKALEEHAIQEAEAKQYYELLKNPAKYLMVASGLKEELRYHFDGFIQATLVDSKPTPTSLHRALVDLEKLQFVVTTNYDTLIERAYQAKDPDTRPCTFQDVGEVQRRIYKRDFFILKAHGDAAKPGNGIVLTEADYREILYRQRAYQSLLSSIFTMYTLVFVGGSMSDPELLLLLNYIADSYSTSSGPYHFALMAKEDINEVERKRWLKDYRVQIIPVSKEDNYAEVTEFLNALKQA